MKRSHFLLISCFGSIPMLMLGYYFSRQLLHPVEAGGGIDPESPADMATTNGGNNNREHGPSTPVAKPALTEKQMFGPDPFSGGLVWLPESFAPDLITKPFSINEKGEVVLTERFSEAFDIGPQERSSIVMAVDHAIENIRDLDLQNREIISQTETETSIRLRGYGDDGSRLRKRFATSLTDVFGESQIDLIYPAFERLMSDLTFDWGTQERSFTFKPLPDGNVEIVGRYGGVSTKWIGNALPQRFSHLAKFELE